MTPTVENEDSNGISSIKYYSLTDENVRKFYDEWRFKTMAIIRKKGWSLPFDDPKLPIPLTKPDDKASEEEKNMFKTNAEAYDQVLMGCSGIPLGLVKRAKGDVRKALTLLDEKYGEEDESNLTELLQEFTGCKLKDTETDPDSWFLEMDRINNKLKSIDVKYEKKDYEMKAHLLGNLPEGYQDVVTKISGNEKNMTVTAIEKEIAKKWKRDFYKSEADDSKTSKNLALTVEAKKGAGWKPTKQFKGKCRKCGKQGHKKADCRSNKKGVCFECGKDGHYAKDCPEKMKDDKKTAGQTGMFVGILLCQMIGHEKKSQDETEKFLMDTGATTHCVSDKLMLVNLEACNETVTIGDGSTVQCTKIGTLYLESPERIIIRLNEVRVIPGIAKNIISVTKLVEAGNKIEMGSGTMLLRNPSDAKILIEKREEPLYYLKARRVSPGSKTSDEVNLHEKTSHDDVDDSAKKDEKKKLEPAVKIDINDAHELYGHVSDGPLRAILEQRNYVIVGDMKTCEPCAYAKAKAKGVSKKPKEPAKEKGERLYLDISGPYKNTIKGSKFWVLVVDDKTRKAWSFFVKKKNDIKQVTNSLILLLKGVQVTTKYIRCDNAGENVKGLGEVCRDHGIVLELTAPHTPQTNGVVERKFVTIRDRAQAMMLGAKLDDEHQGKLWAEAVFTATKLHNAVPNRGTGSKSPDQLWYGQDSRILDHLVKWGRIGYVKDRGNLKKLDAKSTKMVCMGYADNHAGDVYRMYNPDTGTIIATRDVTWAEWHGSQDVPVSLKMFAEDLNVDVKDDQIGEEEVEQVTPMPLYLMLYPKTTRISFLLEQGGRLLLLLQLLQTELQKQKAQEYSVNWPS